MHAQDTDSTNAYIVLTDQERRRLVAWIYAKERERSRRSPYPDNAIPAPRALAWWNALSPATRHWLAEGGAP